MGIGIRFSNCSCNDSSPGLLRVDLPNPNPSNFKIVDIVEANFGSPVCVVWVKYPDCTNYDGRKVLVIEASKAEILAAKTLDPHFCENCKLAPFARFEPTERGWSKALEVAAQLSARTRA